MEYLIAAVVILALGYLVYTKRKQTTETKSEVITEVSYKVETPEVVQPVTEKVEVKEETPKVEEKPVKARKPSVKKAKAPADKTTAKKTPKLKRTK